jgi:hypothetical protein
MIRNPTNPTAHVASLSLSPVKTNESEPSTPKRENAYHTYIIATINKINNPLGRWVSKQLQEF